MNKLISILALATIILIAAFLCLIYYLPHMDNRNKSDKMNKIAEFKIVIKNKSFDIEAYNLENKPYGFIYISQLQDDSGFIEYEIIGQGHSSGLGNTIGGGSSFAQRNITKNFDKISAVIINVINEGGDMTIYKIDKSNFICNGNSAQQVDAPEPASPAR